MVAENQVEVAEQPEVDNKETDVVDYKALYEATKADLEKVAAKKDELYKETKAAKAARDKAAQDAEKIKQDKAIQDGEYETLWKTEKQQREAKEKEYQELKNNIRQDKISISANRIANKLAEGDNAEIISDYISKNLDKLADEQGSLSDDVLAAVEKEFSVNSKYRSLLKGSKARGGEAQGNVSTKAEHGTKEMSYADYSKLDPSQKLEFSKLVNSGKARLLSA